ncbi:protein FAM210B, mitochondrial-like [Cylas formicarius]|uniref:protein FAM210B, mitochondrial-like n=1 Tax=Cylas formicarius TaxID=197179 RepID=UPI002958B062|nr:protein FAM210B, mitochondrial-like [Cylas formicarius]
MFFKNVNVFLRRQCSLTTNLRSKLLSQTSQQIRYRIAIEKSLLVNKSSLCCKHTDASSKSSTVGTGVTMDSQSGVKQTEELRETRAQKLKKAVAEYGTTVIIFHVTISLVSLGTCYLIVSAGLDVGHILDTLGLSKWAPSDNLTLNAGTFAVAYAVHKIFAPVRISVTLGSVPFIVRYLRGLSRCPTTAT